MFYTSGSRRLGIGAAEAGARPLIATVDPRRLREAVRVFAPELRTQARAILTSELVAAAAMSDEQFWSYDSVWLQDAPPTFQDSRKAGMGGGGGSNMSWNNNQFWSLGQTCSRDLFGLVMYQQRRYMAAQLRLAAHLRSVPDVNIVAGFDRLAANPTLTVRDACRGSSIRDNAEAWARWAEHALKLIGVARWASNFTWSYGGKTCADFVPYRASGDDVIISGAADDGNRYPPDKPDAWGVPRVGYIAGTSLRGIARHEVLESSRLARELQRGGRLFDAAVSWQITPVQDRTASSRRHPDAWPEPDYSNLISIAPRALGLHASDRSVAPGVLVPQEAGHFGAMIDPHRGHFPPFMAQPGDTSVGSWLYAYFLEHNVDAAQLAQREETGHWVWRYRDRGFSLEADGLVRSRANLVPASEMVLWKIIAWARDVVDLDFGQLVINGFQNVEMAIAKLPPAFRGSFAQSEAALRAWTAAALEEGATVLGASFAVATSAVGLVPVVGGVLAAVVGIIGLLTTTLYRLQVEVGLSRTVNPPVLQSPAARVAPVVGGDDRCWVNPDPGIESLAQYNQRVAVPFAEAARRVGGDPRRLFDILPEVRAEQAGLSLQTPYTLTAGEEIGLQWVPYAVGGAAALGILYLFLRKR